MVTNKELERQIAIEKKKYNKVRKKELKKLKTKRLKRELFALKHRRGIGVAQKIVRGSQKITKVAVKAGKATVRAAQKYEAAQKKQAKKKVGKAPRDDPWSLIENL